MYKIDINICCSVDIFEISPPFTFFHYFKSETIICSHSEFIPLTSWKLLILIIIILLQNIARLEGIVNKVCAVFQNLLSKTN